MKPTLHGAPGLILCLLLVSSAARGAVPGLVQIPATLPAGIRPQLAAERELCERELAVFQQAATHFSAETADQQTDAEYGRVNALRMRYVADANAFNDEVRRDLLATRAAAAPTAEDRAIEQDRRDLDRQLGRLMTEVNQFQVPPPRLPRHIHEGILLGLFDPQTEANASLGGAVSPFTGRPCKTENIFATADSKTAHEALRGFLDNQTIGAYTLNSDFGRDLVAGLKGDDFDRLIAHSNGATVAEALIKTGVIRVQELDVVGGDRSLVNESGYQNLIDSGEVKRVVVWVNPGDAVPIGSSLAYFAPLGGVNVAPLVTSAEHYANVLAGRHLGGEARVEYRLLKGPGYVGQTLTEGKDLLAPHYLGSAYFPNIAKYFQQHGSTGP